MANDADNHPPISSKEARRRANKHIIFNYGEHTFSELPQLEHFGQSQVWIVTLFISAPPKKHTIGKIIINAQTGEIIEAPTKAQLIECARTIEST